jgi:hypothetical protein
MLMACDNLTARGLAWEKALLAAFTRDIHGGVLGMPPGFDLRFRYGSIHLHFHDHRQHLQDIQAEQFCYVSYLYMYATEAACESANAGWSECCTLFVLDTWARVMVYDSDAPLLTVPAADEERVRADLARIVPAIRFMPRTEREAGRRVSVQRGDGLLAETSSFRHAYLYVTKAHLPTARTDGSSLVYTMLEHAFPGRKIIYDPDFMGDKLSPTFWDTVTSAHDRLDYDWMPQTAMFYYGPRGKTDIPANYVYFCDVVLPAPAVEEAERAALGDDSSGATADREIITEQAVRTLLSRVRL